MATLKELAQRTGYSPATISRILSGDPSLSVSDEARQRVLEEAGRLNYAATKSRRGRAPKSLLRIGLAERLTPQQQLDDPYFLYLGGLVRRHCLEQRYICLPIPALGDSYLPPEGEGTPVLQHPAGYASPRLRLHPGHLPVDGLIGLPEHLVLRLPQGSGPLLPYLVHGPLVLRRSLGQNFGGKSV